MTTSLTFTQWFWGTQSGSMMNRMDHIKLRCLVIKVDGPSWLLFVVFYLILLIFVTLKISMHMQMSSWKSQTQSHKVPRTISNRFESSKSIDIDLIMKPHRSPYPPPSPDLSIHNMLTIKPWTINTFWKQCPISFIVHDFPLIALRSTPNHLPLKIHVSN